MIREETIEQPDSKEFDSYTNNILSPLDPNQNPLIRTTDKRVPL